MTFDQLRIFVAVAERGQMPPRSLQRITFGA
jgi:hypothetical protein